ncbi:hypothetical protein GCM10009304_14530 [Pseudomonas matsuisoli]|uniref:Uncharacterized protein n=1 Tax=Pseudomonas matsuisoli TaxID=1515666 RepID=A0A917UWK1_9PSED|nr:hypothetical protein GCM10009304_14530 [Pseudomonas matsuisoli]
MEAFSTTHAGERMQMIGIRTTEADQRVGITRAGLCKVSRKLERFVAVDGRVDAIEPKYRKLNARIDEPWKDDTL